MVAANRAKLVLQVVVPRNRHEQTIHSHNIENVTPSYKRRTQPLLYHSALYLSKDMINQDFPTAHHK